jgi:hypothetical protein
LPGNYEITVEAKGFRSVINRSISLVANQSAELSFALQIGDVSQTVEVTGNVVGVDTQTANQSVTFSSRVFEDLPLNMRNPFKFVHSVAGATAVRMGVAKDLNESAHGRFAFNGARDSSAAMLVDGISPSSVDWNAVYSNPDVDAVVEVQVVRNSYDVQYGKTSGAVVSMVTKGGTQEFHGLAFNYLRNDHLDANFWQQNRAGLAK